MSASPYDIDFPVGVVTLAPPIRPYLRPVPVLVERPQLRYHGWRRHLKRTMDVAVVLLALPLLLPLMLIVAALVKRSSPGPVLYRQVRLGQHGASFRVLKFRTMYMDSDERLCADPELYRQYVANDFKLHNEVDPRVTRLGRFLRTSSLDELPQLFNVLAGSMSLVGPRPIVPDELSCYAEAASSYLDVRPGLTGRWQVDGRNFVRYPERAHLDTEYLQTWRFRTDVAILMKTVPSVLRRHGAK
jgi:exopolysaccharide production protein ExoY